MNEGFSLDTDDLAAHVAAVTRLASRVRGAADAAQPLQLDAYGLVGRLFAEMIDDTVSTASQAVADVAEVVQRNSEGVDVCQDAYRVTDHTFAELFDAIP